MFKGWGGERDFQRGVEEGEVGQKRADGRVGKMSGNCRTKKKEMKKIKKLKMKITWNNLLVKVTN